MWGPVGTERMKRELEARRFQLHKKSPDKQYVFGKEDGSHAKSFDKSWQRLFDLAGLEHGRSKGLVWHTLRHEFASRTLERSGNPVIAQTLARHKDLRTTLGYIHSRPKDLLSAAAGFSTRSS